jgi:hypothetical protein
MKLERVRMDCLSVASPDVLRGDESRWHGVYMRLLSICLF